MSHEKHWWMLVDGFVDQYNHHREIHFIPSDLICVDQSLIGMAKQATGSTMDCRCMWQLIASQRMDVRSKMHVVAEVPS
jgi:hypothetical protein